MAINPLPILLLFIIIATATARPCKTILYLSSSTTTTTTYFPNPQNSNLKHPSSFTALVFTTTTTRFRKLIPQSSPVTSSSSVFVPMRLYSSVGERSKDIMNIVGALLFGVGCGALTAATVFFIWVICSPRGYDDDEEDYEKMGYAAINDDLEKEKRSVPLAKEVV